MKRKNKPGAGRPPGITKIQYSTRLNTELVLWLRKQKKAAQIIETALREYIKKESR